MLKRKIINATQKIEDQPPNFIRTKGAISRIKTVVDGIKSGIPLLLEGETGTSKTATARQAAAEIKQKVIVFNFSSQTSIEDLLGRVSKNNDSWSGFSFIKGPFTEAFENGYCIILDEINLAHETVLQCIEASLDCQQLSLDFAGANFNKIIQMHPEFHLIATQNPLTNRFSQKRNFLSHKFTSRFQKITFNEIGYDELLEIATGLSKNINNMTPNLIKAIVRFHFEWQKSNFSQMQINNFSTNYVFTIREICRTIMSIEKGLTPFESILVNYGARYNDQTKEKIKILLKKLGIKEEGTFFSNNFCISTIKSNFSLSDNPRVINTNKKNNFYMTDTLENVFSNSFHLFDNFQSILIVGPDGCGKTSIGRWIGELYPSVAKTNAFSNSKFFICNPEMMISDVIGRYVLYKKDMKANKEEIINEIQIEWKYGPVVEAAKNGDCLILDQIDKAPSTILERLNSLFDGIGQKNFNFPIQENPEEPDILVNPRFRIIATSSLDGLNNLSPALLNRFTIVYVNEQLDFIGDQLEPFITCLSPYSSVALKGSNYVKIIVDTINVKLSKNSKLTSLNLSRCVNGFFKILKKFPKEIKKKDVISILDFCLYACIDQSREIPDLDDNFIDVMLNDLDDDNEGNQQYDTFHFKEAKSTRKVMATLVACSIIGLHMILIGRTGIGKTAAAMAFSRTLKSNKGKNTTPHMVSFNGETQLDDLYGYFTIEDGNFTDHHGELSQAMADGQVFIADELNLAEEQIIQSLNVAIEPSSGENIILPVTGSSITVKEGFFFIGCQNDLTMKGRKQLPESIKKKVFCINYPESSREDFTKLCTSIARPFHIDNAIPRFSAFLIEKINADSSLKSWSLREVRILFRRISYFQSKTQDVKGFTSMHHVAFMLISAFKDQTSMINKIAKLVCSCFVQDKELESLTNDLTAKIKVLKIIDDEEVSQSHIDSLQQNSDMKNDSDYLVKIIKGSLEINIHNKQLFFIPDNIQQLWQTIFEVYLTYPSEPLLLNGPSGFKTYLSILISSLSPVIYLHSDSTVSSLIGQITLLDLHQAKTYLFDSLYDFAGYNLSIKKQLNDIKLNIEENVDFEVEALNSVIERIKKNLPSSFIPILQNVANRLINIQNDESDDKSHFRMFSNFTSLFKPGLITRSIFQQNSLILKNFAQPSPSVIERFNELLSVTPSLTLFEDTTSTFTSENHNKLYGFSNNFRIIGICLPYEKRNLSDAMLSRLTEVQVPEYSIEEQENVFMTYLQNRVDKHKTLHILRQALSIFERYKFNISFRQKIKIIEVANQWLKKHPKKNLETVYSISILRCAGGSLSFEMRQELYKSMKNNSFDFPLGFSDIYQVNTETEAKSDFYKYTTEKSCLYLDREGTTITSSLSGFTYKNISFSNDFLNMKPNLRFSKSLNDLVDVIFSFSIINYPLIIEGPNGCGKYSAFFYVAQCLGMKVIQISLSQSTTIEDLFGRSEPSSKGESIHFEFKPTAFLNAIDKERNNGEKYWILIEDLHLASPSVIDALEPIFNSKSDFVTLPDGSFITKSNFFIVGLLSKPLQKQSITSTALYHKMPNYSKKEFSEICRFIFETNQLDDSVHQICPILSQLYEISMSSQVKTPLTPREAHKFVKMMKAASQHSSIENKFSDIQICQLLSLGRFYDDELKLGIIQNINAAVKRQVFTENEEIPEFTIENGNILTSKNVSINSPIGIQSYMNDINHLTKSEKQLFEFLILNTDEYTPLIVQGPTASGKTFSIQLFAKILGKNLKVLQMNQEINSSFIVGSYNPSKNLSSSDIFELRNALELISSMPYLPDKFQEKLQNIEIEKWKLSDFLELKKEVEKLMKSKKLDESNINNASEFINKVNSTLLIFKHINRSDSIIVEALKKGDWLLLDGIENATSDLLDRLSSLLDDPPVLNLYERGTDYIFSMKPDPNNKTKLIDPNFRLFITYNPINSYSNNVSQSFLSRCTLYSMSPIDSNIFDSALIVSNIIEKSVFSFSSQSEIAARIAKVHMKMKEKNQKQLTCRTLIHVSREIFYRNKLQKLDNQQIIGIINNHYHSNDIQTIFNETIDKMLINQLEKFQMDTIKIRNFMVDNVVELYQQIDYIIKNKSDINLVFKYNEFLSNMYILQFKNYDDIVHELEKINSLITSNIKLFSKQQLSYLASFNTLSELFTNIFNVFNSMNKSKKDEIQNLSISQIDVSVFSNLDDVIFQFHSFQFLYNNHFYIDQIPDIFINSKIANNYFATCKASPTFKRYQFHKDVTPIQQICSTFFRSKDCQFLFKGIMEDIYLFSYSIFSLKKFNNFCEWINWLNAFFISFMSIIDDFNIPFDMLKQKIQIIEDEKDSNLIVSLLNQIEKIRNIPTFVVSQSKKISPKIHVILSFIDTTYNNLHDLYANIADNKRYAKLFLDIKKRCETLINSHHKIPIGYYIDYVNSLSEEQISRNIPLFVKIFNSIVKKETIQKELSLSWPTNENLGAIKDERSILFESLISYSSELQTLSEINLDDPQWKLLCQLSEPKVFLTEFINTKKISKLTIFNYISFLNAQLLTNIIESNRRDPYDYCNMEKLIAFFNKFITAEIEPSWLKIVHNASKNYPGTFMISIPSFSPLDIVSLFINPFTKMEGCFFKENELPNYLIDAFSKEFDYMRTNPKDQTFEFIHRKIAEIFIQYLNNQKIKSKVGVNIENLINNIIEDISYKNIHALCKKVLFIIKLCQTQGNSSRLDFSDIQKINFNSFNEYIKNYPKSGYYIAQFPEVRTNLELIQELCTIENIEKNKIPLALFEFRIFSRLHSIKFQLPAEFPLSFCEEFQTCISRHLSFKNNKNFIFSNLVGFLLLNPPQFIKDTQYSRYVRDIIISLMTTYEDDMLLKEIMKLLINFLPRIIDVLGSPGWQTIICKELKYDNTNREGNEIINFLSNPWYFTLGQIYNDFMKDYEKKNEEVKKSVTLILKMITDLVSEQSIEKLKDYVEKDEADYQDKRVQLYINDERKNEKESENIQNLIKMWNYYSKHVRSLVDTIQPLPSAQSKSFEYKPQDWYDDFYKFFKDEKLCLSCKKEEVMVIFPKSDHITIKFTKNKKKISIDVKVDGMSLFLNNKQIKYEIIGGDHQIISIPYDHNVLRYKSSTMKQIITYYSSFRSFYEKVNEEDLSKYNYEQIVEKIGEVKLFFGSNNIDDLIKDLIELY